STGQSKVIMIAHSTGGVISEAYTISNQMNSLLGRPRRDTVNSIITIGTPFWGVPKAYYGLADGYDFGNLLAPVDAMKLIAQNATALYQLLPRQSFVTDTTTGTSLSLDDTYLMHYKSFVKWFPTGSPSSPAWQVTSH